MKKNNMKIEWAWIEPETREVTVSDQVQFCMSNIKNTSCIPDHDDVNESGDIMWLNYDNVKVAVAFENKGFQSFLFKELERIQFTANDGRTGDLLDFVDHTGQVMALGFKVHDDLGRYEVDLEITVEGTPIKSDGVLLPNYLVIRPWKVSANR